MKRKQYHFEPETVAEKDGISALKSAYYDYAATYPSLFDFQGNLPAKYFKNSLGYIKAKLEAVEVDEFGRDANGVDIAAALMMLEYVEAV